MRRSSRRKISLLLDSGGSYRGEVRRKMFPEEEKVKDENMSERAKKTNADGRTPAQEGAVLHLER